MRNDFEYEVTCYRDKNYELGGKLFLSDDVYIDFDTDIAFRENIPISDIKPIDLFLLKNLIALGSLSRDKLAELRFGEDFYEKDEDDIHKALSNFKWRINTHLAEIITYSRKNSVFSVKLSKKIKRFPDIAKKDVHSIRELFPEAYSGEKSADTELPSVSVSEFCKKFLHSGALDLFNASGDTVIAELSRLSDIFRLISTVDSKAAGMNVIKDLYDIIIKECRSESVKDILKIKGPLGSYKNRIMQYLYLAVEKNNNDILPFYIDIAFYERIAESDVQISEENIIGQLNIDFDTIKIAVNKEKTRIPLLFLDGIRDFSRGNESLYSSIRKRIKELKCKTIICLDADFTANNQHKFNVHPLGTNGFKHYMRISSMSLYRKDDCIDFIRSCTEMTKEELPDSISAKQIYNNLIRLGFTSVDAYWLIYMLKTVFKCFIDSKSNIADVYTAICMDILNDAKLLDSAAELAYRFEFEANLSGDSNLNYDIRWRLIRKHRSILDFLIAKHYTKKILSLHLTNEKTDENARQLSIFNMIIQGHIAKFAFVLLSGNDDYEHQIMRAAKSHYDRLSLIGKSELTFRMTALANPRRKQECIRLIKKYTETEKAFYLNIAVENIDEKKDSAFLLRSLFINLIYENNREAFVDYFNLLLNDKLANSVNRGFHLEYYGDKAYIPDKTLLDFEDDVSKGRKAFDMLCLTLNERMEKPDAPVFAAAIEIASLCSLIQARIEQSHEKKVFNVRPYLNNCITYLNWITRKKQIRDIPEAVMYFTWMRDELKEQQTVSSDEINEAVKYYPATPFNGFCSKNNGTTEETAVTEDSSAEHMYNCWLMGMLYLPEEYSDAEYDKNTVLQMLLVHDLAEAKTGRISHIDRYDNSDTYDIQDNMTMQKLFLSATYPGAADLNKYLSHWNSWHKKDGINYLIAKDIDNIQSAYCFCRSYSKNPDAFTKDDISYWLSVIYGTETEPGKEIAKKLILKNPIYNGIFD